jgi:hypothetical protein
MTMQCSAVFGINVARISELQLDVDRVRSRVSTRKGPDTVIALHAQVAEDSDNSAPR